MNSDQGGVHVTFLLKGSGNSFFTRRVLQRWERGEIDTVRAVELIQADDAGRIMGTWNDH